MMKPSVWTDYFEMLPPEEAILSLKEAGFAYAEMGVDHSRMLQARCTDVEKTGSAFRQFLDGCGFTLPEAHLDFQKELIAPGVVDHYKKEITLFQAIGMKRAVIHINGGDDLPEAERIEKQLSAMEQLLAFVKGTDFSICLENLRPNPTVADSDKILWWIRQLGGENLGICLDTGHLHVSNISKKSTTQSQRDFILGAGSYLQATHINGNDGTDDYHLAPYAIKNSIHWPEVVTALREIGYQGLFTLEIPGEIKGNPPMYVLKRKLKYLKELVDFLLSPAFPEQNS